MLRIFVQKGNLTLRDIILRLLHRVFVAWKPNIYIGTTFGGKAIMNKSKNATELNQRKNNSGLIDTSKNQITWQEKTTENSQMDCLSGTLVSKPWKRRHLTPFVIWINIHKNYYFLRQYIKSFFYRKNNRIAQSCLFLGTHNFI